MRIPATLLSLVLMTIACVSAHSAASASSMQIRPVHIDLTKGNRTATATIINESNEPLRVQVTGYTWQQDPQGEMRLAPSDDVILFPSLLVIPPLSSKSVRVAIDAMPGAAEKTYRLYFEELPSLQSQLHPTAGPTLILRQKIGIPIFLSGESGTNGRVLVQDAHAAAGRVSFALHNAGATHAMVTQLNVVGLDGAGKMLYTQHLKTWYVLAGGDRNYVAKIPPALCGKLAQVKIEGKGDGTPSFEQKLGVSDGCGR